MDDQPPNLGPSRETLLNLKAMMPSFIKGMAKKKVLGKGIVSAVRRPRKVCPVCGLLFDHAMIKPTEDVKIETQPCKTCDTALKDGYCALVCGDKYALLKSAELEDWAGKIKQVSPHVIESLEKQYAVTTLKINGSHRENTEPPEAA